MGSSEEASSHGESLSSHESARLWMNDTIASRYNAAPVAAGGNVPHRTRVAVGRHGTARRLLLVLGEHAENFVDPVCWFIGADR